MFAQTSTMLLVASAAMFGQVRANTGLVPSDLPQFVDVLTVSELQAPTSDDDVDILTGYSSANFFVQVLHTLSQCCYNLLPLHAIVVLGWCAHRTSLFSSAVYTPVRVQSQWCLELTLHTVRKNLTLPTELRPP